MGSSDLDPKDHLQWFAKISQSGGEEARCEEDFLATQLDKWILWPREVAEVVRLDVIQQKLSYTWERPCSYIALPQQDYVILY